METYQDNVIVLSPGNKIEVQQVTRYKNAAPETSIKEARKIAAKLISEKAIKWRHIEEIPDDDRFLDKEILTINDKYQVSMFNNWLSMARRPVCKYIIQKGCKYLKTGKLVIINELHGITDDQAKEIIEWIDTNTKAGGVPVEP